MCSTSGIPFFNCNTVLSMTKFHQMERASFGTYVVLRSALYSFIAFSEEWIGRYLHALCEFSLNQLVKCIAFISHITLPLFIVTKCRNFHEQGCKRWPLACAVVTRTLL